MQTAAGKVCAKGADNASSDCGSPSIFKEVTNMSRRVAKADTTLLAASREMQVAVERATLALARLDAVSAGSPVRCMFDYRFCMELLRRQAHTGGYVIGHWQLAAALEGVLHEKSVALEMQASHAPLDVARHIVGHYRRLTEPNLQEEGLVQEATDMLQRISNDTAVLLTAASCAFDWVSTQKSWSSFQVALCRFWSSRNFFQATLPAPNISYASGGVDRAEWLHAFLDALNAEALEGLLVLRSLQQIWFVSRCALMKTSKLRRTVPAFDLLAAVPTLSALSLARSLDIPLFKAEEFLELLTDAEIAIEVTSSTRSRLFALRAMDPRRRQIGGPQIQGGSDTSINGTGTDAAALLTSSGFVDAVAMERMLGFTVDVSSIRRWIDITHDLDGFKLLYPRKTREVAQRRRSDAGLMETEAS